MSNLDYKTLTWDEASERHPLGRLFNQDITEYDPDFANSLCVALFEGNTHIDKLIYSTNNRSFSGFDESILVIIVVGDLTVDTYIDLMVSHEYGTPIMVYVTGSLKAENLFVSEVGELVVGGDIDLGYSFFVGDTEGGLLSGKGKLSTRFGYISGDGWAYFKNPQSGIIYCAGEITQNDGSDCKFLSVDDVYLVDENNEANNIFLDHVQPKLKTSSGQIDDIEKYKYWILKEGKVFREDL